MAFCKTFNPNLTATVNYTKCYSIAVEYCFGFISFDLWESRHKFAKIRHPIFASFLKFIPRILLN